MAKLNKEEFMELVAEVATTKAAQDYCEIKVDGDYLNVFLNEQKYATINMLPFYSGYCYDAMTMSKIADIVGKIAAGAKFSSPEIDSIVQRFDTKVQPQQEKLKNDLLDNVYFMLVHKDSEAGKSGALMREYADMRAVYYLGNDKNNLFSPELITKEMNITEGEMFQHAVANMMCDINVTTTNAYTKVDVDCHDNHDKDYGAAPMVFPGILKAVAEKFEDDLYIVPVCTDMFYVFRVSTERPDYLDMMLNAGNTLIPSDMILSNNVFYYNKEKDTLAPVNNTSCIYKL